MFRLQLTNTSLLGRKGNWLSFASVSVPRGRNHRLCLGRARATAGFYY